MSQIKMDSEDIAAIRNALEIILKEARRVYGKCLANGGLVIITEVKRIVRLLPVVKFEGVK